MATGERRGFHRLGPGQRAVIRRLLAAGLSPTVIERRTGVSRQTIRRIRDEAKGTGSPVQEAPSAD